MFSSFLLNCNLNTVGTVKENLSPQGLGDSSNVPSRTNEVIRLEKELLAACKGEDTFLPCFLVDSFHGAHKMNKAMGRILRNPKKENMAIREGIVLEKTCDALKVLSSQRYIEQLDKFRAEREEQDDNFRQAQLENAQHEESDPRKAEQQVNTTCTIRDNEKKARKARLSDEPEDGLTILIRASTGTFSRKFKRHSFSGNLRLGRNK
ncbi:unnamed protein product [Porites evermanni]|uniref:Uncharacterized protein n=1 Tax=Porites evermanni TaxID=104178 RepID=A0ABN8STC6_9CNID|nr:unnamed protein product [Porites evermanni]